VISRRKGWVLGREAFEKLLSTLDSDRDRAAEKYETIRRQLVRVFRWRGCSESEALADETIDRVSRKLDEGEEIRASDPAVYFYGVARNVLKEFWTEQRKEQTLERLAAPATQFPGAARDLGEQEIDERLECLDRCLARLSRENRELITVYYRSEKSGKIAERVALAKSLDLSPGALRIRAHRIRRQLEECVNEGMRKRADG
jgi:DNA-directed RNA polymerase specialized sigma24 family protein